MADNINKEQEMLEGLVDMIGAECLECGFVNSTDAEYCEECGADMEPEYDEDRHISVMQDTGVMGMAGGVDPGMAITPLDNSEHLVLLVETARALDEDNITMQQYRQNVARVLNVARPRAEMLNSKEFHQKIENFPEKVKEFAQKTGEYFQQLFEGCKMMMEYDGGSNKEPAFEGFLMAEKALENMDRLQYDIADSYNDFKDEE